MNTVQIELFPVARLKPYARAMRKNDHAISRMVTLIEEFGFKLPMLIRADGELVDGHLRLKAAQKLKLTEVPVMRCDEWTDVQVKAFRLAVNRSASWAEWDSTIVTQELEGHRQLRRLRLVRPRLVRHIVKNLLCSR